jgi:hypothetical protein
MPIFICLPLSRTFPFSSLSFLKLLFQVLWLFAWHWSGLVGCCVLMSSLMCLNSILTNLDQKFPLFAFSSGCVRLEVQFDVFNHRIDNSGTDHSSFWNLMQFLRDIKLVWSVVLSWCSVWSVWQGNWLFWTRTFLILERNAVSDLTF